MDHTDLFHSSTKLLDPRIQFLTNVC